MAKTEIFRTPAGRAVYPKLTEPDTKFKENGEYSVQLLLTEAEAQPIVAQCEAVRQQAFDEQLEKLKAEKPKMAEAKLRETIKLADLPIKRYEAPETGEETEFYRVNFKMAAAGTSKKTGKPWTRHPQLFDARNNPISSDGIQIWSGSVLKVAYSLVPFFTKLVGAGASLRLEAVQIIELVSGGARDAAGYGFEAQEDGYEYHKDSGGFSAVGSEDDDAASDEEDF